MKGVRLEPARGLLESFPADDLKKLAARARVDVGRNHSPDKLVEAIAARLDLDGIVSTLRELFPQAAPEPDRLDVVGRLSGDVTVQVCSKSDAALGDLLLENGGACLLLQLPDTQLFLEGRWPVLVRGLGPVPHDRLYAAFVRPGQVHPDAGAPPPKTKPFIVDEGKYGLRNGRFRLELCRVGQLSFSVTHLRRRPRSGENEYLLEPIA